MPILDQEFARIRNKVLKLEQGGTGGGISSVNIYVSGSNDVLSGSSFYLSGNNGITLTSSVAGNTLTISASIDAMTEVPISSFSYTNVSSVYTVAGGNLFNIDDFVNTNYYFKVAGYVDSPCTMSVQLYNLTDAAVVTTVDITSTVATSSDITSVSLTGNKFYETRFKRVSGSEANNVYLLNSSIKVI